MNAKDAAELLKVIADHAQKLRESGVRGRVELGDIAFTLADPEGAGGAAQPLDDAPPSDALADPETFGLHGPDAPRRVPRRARVPLVGADQ